MMMIYRHQVQGFLRVLQTAPCAHLVHTNIQGVMRFCVDLKLDFGGRQLERAAL